MALKMFSVRRISASSVALHLPSSSALRSTRVDLPTLPSSALYCTSRRASSSFLSLSSCSRLLSSFSRRFFSSLCTFLSCSNSFCCSACSSTRTSSRTCTFSRWERLWSCRMFTLATRSAFRSRSSSAHHSARKLLRARSSSLASFCACSSRAVICCCSWCAASSSESWFSSSCRLRLSSCTCLLWSAISALSAFCSAAPAVSSFLSFWRLRSRRRLISSRRCAISPFLRVICALRISDSLFLVCMAACKSSSLVLASSSICFMEVVQFLSAWSRSVSMPMIFWLSMLTLCSWSCASCLHCRSRLTFSALSSLSSLPRSSISFRSDPTRAACASRVSSHSAEADCRLSWYCAFSRWIVWQSSSSLSRCIVKILSSSFATRFFSAVSELSWLSSCFLSLSSRKAISSFFFARLAFRLTISACSVSSISCASRRTLPMRPSVSAMSWLRACLAASSLSTWVVPSSSLSEETSSLRRAISEFFSPLMCSSLAASELSATSFRLMVFLSSAFSRLSFSSTSLCSFFSESSSRAKDSLRASRSSWPCEVVFDRSSSFLAVCCSRSRFSASSSALTVRSCWSVCCWRTPARSSSRWARSCSSRRARQSATAFWLSLKRISYLISKSSALESLKRATLRSCSRREISTSQRLTLRTQNSTSWRVGESPWSWRSVWCSGRRRSSFQALPARSVLAWLRAEPQFCSELSLCDINEYSNQNYQ